MDHSDDETPAEQMVRELGLDPALGRRPQDSPLIQSLRDDNARAAQRAREMREPRPGDPSPSSGDDEPDVEGNGEG